MFSISEINSILYADLRKTYNTTKIPAINPLMNAIAEQQQFNQKKDQLQSLQTALINLKAGSEIIKKTSLSYSSETFSTESKVVTAVADAFSTFSNYIITDITLAKNAQKTSTEKLNIADSGSTSKIISTAAINKTGSGNVDQNKILSDNTNNLQGYSNIHNGSITINNKTITIDTSKDTLDSVLNKITSSGAGVTAKLENNKVVIQSSSKGENEINITNDTSHLTSVLKINSSESFTKGTISDIDKPLSEITTTNSTLTKITSGSFNINGVSFTVDTKTESLQNVINKINSSKAEVTVSYDEKSDKITMTSKQEAKNIELSNTDSNFITQTLGNTDTTKYTPGQVTINNQKIGLESNTLKISRITFTFKENSIPGANITIGHSVENAKNEIKTFVNKFNTFVNELTTRAGKGKTLSDNLVVQTIEKKLEQLPHEETENTGTYKSLEDIGITAKDGKLVIDDKKLEQALKTNPNSVAAIFNNNQNNNSPEDGGLINKLINAILSPALASKNNDLISSITAMELSTENKANTTDNLLLPLLDRYA